MYARCHMGSPDKTWKQVCLRCSEHEHAVAKCPLYLDTVQGDLAKQSSSLQGVKMVGPLKKELIHLLQPLNKVGDTSGSTGRVLCTLYSFKCGAGGDGIRGPLYYQSGHSDSDKPPTCRPPQPVKSCGPCPHQHIEGMWLGMVQMGA